MARRYDLRTQQIIQNKRVDKFIEEMESLCRTHKLCIVYLEKQMNYVVVPFSEYDFEQLSSCWIGSETGR